MLYVDDRAGSDELVEPLRKLGLPVEEKRLKSADIAFTGRGVNGTPLLIGVEHKKMSDLVQSLTTGRLQEQIERQVQVYDRSWLLVEGEWDFNDEGKVTMWAGRKKRPLRGSPPAAELLQRLLTVYTRADVSVWPAHSRRASLIFLVALYRWWTDKDLDEHKSHVGMKSPDAASMVPLSDFRRGLMVRLPDIGIAASKAIEDRCWDDTLVPARGSERKLMFLTTDDWAELETIDRHGNGKRLGRSRAERIVEALK